MKCYAFFFYFTKLNGSTMAKPTELGYFGHGRRFHSVETNSIAPISASEGVIITNPTFSYRRLNLTHQFEAEVADAAAGTDQLWVVTATGSTAFSSPDGLLRLTAPAGGGVISPAAGTLWEGSGGIWAPNQEPQLEIRLHTVAEIADSIYIAGFGVSTDADDGDSEQVLFTYNAATDTNWQFVATSGSTDEAGTPKDTGVAVADDTVYTLSIKFEKSSTPGAFIAKAYINGVLVHTTGDLSAALEAASLLPKIGDDTAIGGAALDIMSVTLLKPQVFLQ